MADADRDAWSKIIFDQLIEAGVSLFSYVPDHGNAKNIDKADEKHATPAEIGKEAGMGKVEKSVGSRVIKKKRMSW